MDGGMIQIPRKTSRSDAPAAPRKEWSGGVVLEMAGAESCCWLRWHYPRTGEPVLLAEGNSLPKKSTRTIALPTRSLFAWPLWIASEGEETELVRLELSGRHLLKRGMEETLTLIPVLEEENRRLVLALATEEPFPGEVMPKAWRDAGRFVIVPHLFESVTGSDLILWMEWETLQMAFCRAGKVVWFCGLREQALGDMVLRSALKLLSDRVLDHLPSSVTITRMPRASADLCAAEIKRVLPSVRTRLEPHSVTVNDLHPPSPRLPERILDIPPTEARSERIRRKKTNRLLSIATAGAFIYLLLLAWGIGDLLILKSSLNYLRKETSLLEAPSMQARKLSERWNALRPAIDPSTYPLDLLAAVATPTESGKVRLTAFTLEQGRLQISGEATDVTQAYAFIEQLKKNPLLQEYDWTAGQPQLAGKNSVRFEMDGALPASPRSAP